MSFKQNTRCWYTILAVTGLSPALSYGVGFRVPNQDPEAVARANAYVATADNPSAIYYNPAGLRQLDGQNVRVGVYAVSLGIDYKKDGQTYHGNSDLQAMPELYYAYSLPELPLTVGLGAYTPYGLGMDWGNRTPFATEAEKAQLTYLCINPVVAYSILTNLSVGVGPTLNYSYADIRQGVDLHPYSATDGQFHLKGDGWAYGFNAGVQWQPHPKWSLGLNYRSVTTVRYEGPTDISPAWVTAPNPNETSANASIRFPQFVVGGVSYRPTPDWNIEFDLDWTDWDSLNQVVMNHTPVGQRVWPMNYRSSFMYELGVTRQLPKGFFASAGYFFSENSIPDQTFNPIIPDTYLHVGSIGLGHKGKLIDWMVAYQVGYNPGREVSNDKAFPDANGTYTVLNHAVSVAATLKF